MKGDFSRLTFDKTKHYSAVLKQQGRVDLDADWNELQAINRHHLETGTADVIGCCGAPARAPGFRIVTNTADLLVEERKVPGNANPVEIPAVDFLISAGRIYVDGILCENEKAILFSQQSDLPLAAISQTGSQAIVYLDVWQRHITALDDPQIRETALGGPDTATRLKTVWQVKVLPISIRKFNPVVFSDHISELAAAFKKLASVMETQVSGDLEAIQRIQKSSKALVASKAALAKWRPTLQDASDLLDKIEGLHLSQELVPIVSGFVGPIRNQLALAQPITCKNPPSEWNLLVAPGTGKLTARTQPAPPSDDPCCTIPPGAGYRGLENQLYRVEIHRGNVDGNGATTGATPTFKWSRDNGSVVTAITGIDSTSKTLSVHDIGPDNVLGFAIGQWVEVLDDTRELHALPGDLLQITDMPPNSNQIIVAGTLTIGFNHGVYHPKLRRWDSAGEIKTDGTWQPLENGIEVQFSNGTYKTGDYWVIPARTSGDIEWPQDTTSQPVPQPPRGIRHHYCRLAIIKRVGQRLERVGQRLEVVEDCRCVFPPLCGKPPALHITKVSFRDDSKTPVTNGKEFNQEMLSNGIAVVCDGQVDSKTINLATCFVTIDLPYPMFGQALTTPDVTPKTTPEVVGFLPLILAADPSLDKDGQTILWKPRVLKRKFLEEEVWPILQKSGEKGILAHLRLKGNFIWAADASQTYLDGEAFGASDADNVASNLRLPSGDGRRGGDFEMWFWVVGPPPQPSPQPSPPKSPKAKPKPSGE
jgi:hypothetical protein